MSIARPLHALRGLTRGASARAAPTAALACAGFTRKVRQWIARALIGFLLFGQLAVAAYACPAFSSAGVQAAQAAENAAPRSADGGAPTAAAGAAGAMDCEQMSAMDDASPNLCAEHCRHGQQSDQATTIAIPAVLLNSLYLVAPFSGAADGPPPARSRLGLHAAVAPPHAILHCCLRD